MMVGDYTLITGVSPLDSILVLQASSGLVKRITLQALVSSIVAQTKNAMQVSYVNADTVLDFSMGLVVVNSSGPVTLTLPLASTNKGIQIPVEMKGAGIVTIVRSGVDTIAGGTSFIMTQYEKENFVSDGVNLWSY